MQSLLLAKAAKQKAFTLLELLTVVALIVILVGLSVGGGSLVRGRMLDTAGNRVGLLFDFARQRAMAGNVLTAVVLITNSGAAEDGRAFTILEYSGGSKVWKQAYPWEVLPEGFCVDMGNDTTTSTYVSQPDPSVQLPYAASSPVVFRGRNLTAQQYAYRIFLPSGGLWTTSSNPVRLQLVEGAVEDGVTKYRKPPDNYYRISLVTATGRTKVERPGF